MASVSIPDWKAVLCQSLVDANQKQRSYAPLISEYQSTLAELKQLHASVSDVRRQNALLRDEKNLLERDVEQLKSSGSEDTRKKLEDLEMRVHAQQEELTNSYRAKVENTEELLRLNRSLQDAEEKAKSATILIETLRAAVAERDTRVQALEKVSIDKSNAMIALQEEYKAEKAERNRATELLRKLEKDHEELVQRWMEKVKKEAERMNKKLEEEDTRVKEHRSRSLQESALRNYGNSLDMSELDISLIPTRLNFQIAAHSSDGNDVCFSRSGDMIASCSTDKDVKIWEAGGGTLQTCLTGHAQAVMCVCFAPDDEFVLGSSNDNSIRVWRYKTGQVLHALTGHQNKVYSAKYCDQNRVVSGSCDRTIKLWDLTRGYCTRTVLCISSCNTVCPDKTGSIVASGHFDKSVKLWDMRDGKETQRIQDLHAQQVTHVEIAFDDRKILSVGREGILKVTDIRTYEPLIQISNPQLQIPTNWSKACFSPDSNHVAVGGHEGAVFVFEVASGSCKQILRGVHESPVVSCGWSVAQSQLASIDKTGVIAVWGP